MPKDSKKKSKGKKKSQEPIASNTTPKNVRVTTKFNNFLGITKRNEMKAAQTTPMAKKKCQPVTPQTPEEIRQARLKSMKEPRGLQHQPRKKVSPPKKMATPTAKPKATPKPTIKPKATTKAKPKVRGSLTVTVPKYPTRPYLGPGRPNVFTEDDKEKRL